MVNLRKHIEGGQVGKSNDNESTPSKRPRRSVNQREPSVGNSQGSNPPVSDSDSPRKISTRRTSRERADTPICKQETPVKRQPRRSTHLLVSPTPDVISQRKRSLTTDYSMSPSELPAVGRKSDRLSSKTSYKPVHSQTPTISSEKVFTDDSSQTQLPTRRSRRLSTDTCENTPHLNTPTKQRKLSTDKSENTLLVQTPTRRSRRLSTDLSENPPLVQTPVRHSRRLSGDYGENPSSMHTPTRRSRRLSNAIDDSISEENISDKMTGKEPTTDIPVTQLNALSRHKNLNAEVISSPTSKGQPSISRRSRRLSSDLVKIPEDDGVVLEDKALAPSKPPNVKKEVATAVKSSLGSNTPVRRSRRKSGSGVLDSSSENALSVVEEVEEKEESTTCTQPVIQAKRLSLEVIEEEKEVECIEKKNEPEIQILNDNDDTITRNSLYEIMEIDDKGDSKNSKSISQESAIKASDKLKDRLSFNLRKETSEKQSPAELHLAKEVSSSQMNDEDDDIEVLQKITTPSIVQSIKNDDIENIEPVENMDLTIKEKENNMLNNEIATNTTVENNTEVNSSTVKSIGNENKKSKTGHNVSDSVSAEELMTCEDSHSFVVTDDKKAAVQHSSLQHSNQDQSFINAKGKPVSGRWWKPEKKRFTSIIKDQGLRSSWAAKMERKRELKDQLAMKRSLVEEKKRKKIELVERQKLNIIRREENAKKAEIVQVIKDSRKIKKMKRKQLRYIETRDTSLLKKA